MRWTRMLLVMLGALFAVVPAASANTYRVTGFGDEPGAICFADNCPTLRAAVTAAESPGGPHTISLPAGDYQLTQGQLLLNSNVTITGAGARATTIRGNANAFRVIEVAATKIVAISGVTMRDGWALFDNGSFRPGGVVANRGTLTLDRVRVSGGNATSGGGIANLGGTLTIERSLIDGNDGGSDAGGILNFSGGTATIRNTTIANNRANQGGAYLSWGGSVSQPNHGTLEFVTMAGNDAGFSGGFGYDAGTGDTMLVRGSILVANSVSSGQANCGNPPTSGGGNVESGTECGFETQSAADVLGTSLQNLGGDTDTFSVPAGSPARDRVAAVQCPATDQRGLPRPLGLPCDAGALEADTPVIAVTSPASGAATEAATVELRGTAPPTAPVTVYRNGAAVAQGAADAQGVYAIVVGLDVGDQTFEVETPGEWPRASVRVIRTVPSQPTPAPTTTPVPSPTPTATPVVNRTIVVGEERGTIKVKVPGSNRYDDLDVTKGIPVGSTVDARKGRVRLTSVPKAGAPPETAVFYDGLFKVTQTKGITNLTLTEQLARCPKKGRAATAAKKAKKRKLWGDGKGSFRTTGKYSAATVRGTKWLVEDSCAGTLTRVTQGVVTVKAGKVTKTLRAGKKYLARPR